MHRTPSPVRRLPGALALSLLSLALLSAAGCSGSDEGACSPEAQKRDTLEIARSWYLYPDLLPETVNLADYADADDLLYGITAQARTEGKDRGWSFVTTATQTQAFYGEGRTMGFGFGFLNRGGRIFVSQVFSGSAAYDAGFRRGDEITAIGTPPGPLVPIATVLSTGLGAALGPNEDGVTRAFEMIPVGTAATEIRTPSKRAYFLDPVPAWRTWDGAGGKKLGYVGLRTFIGPADDLLRQAFQSFLTAGVTDVVVDLRYNGGGLVSTGQLLSNLLGGGLAGRTMYSVRNNSLHALEDRTYGFAPAAQSVTPMSVAFVTTRSSASASELVPNAMEPWRSVALVGKPTYGKPVGQRGFELAGCDVVVYVVSFKLVNAQEEGDYFSGLPDANVAFTGPLCDAEDEIGREQDDPLEASTAAALHFLENGTCPPPPAAPASSPTAVRVPDEYPAPPEPSFAQRHVRGLF